MSGYCCYQSIPSASSVDSIENGLPSNRDRDRSAPHSYPCSSPSSGQIDSHPVGAATSLASKLGYISVGIVVGCISSRSLLRWGPVSDNNNAKASIKTHQRSNAPQSFLTNGKSFLDSLPFEEVVPYAWNPAQPRPYEQKLTNLLSSSSPNDPSAINERGMNLLSASILASKPDAPSPGPHLLYHAHESSFNLLYDDTKSSHLSEYALDYFLLNSGGFDAQINQAYCSVATVAAVLNSLKYAKRFRDGGDLSEWSFDLPVDPRYDPYPYATQTDILTGDCVWNHVIEYGDGTNGEHGGHVNGIFKPPYGLSLEQAGKLLECHTSDEWAVTVQEVDPSQLTLSKMRYDLKASLIDPDARIMINYDRGSLGQVGGGHFSPVAAYHQPTDSFLIMDVAKYKYPPVWVAADSLHAAMATVDKCGTYDYPKGQERLNDNESDETSSKLFNPITHEEFLRSLELLNCKEKMRGYIILEKKGY